MRRIHLFELEDLAWVPRPIRDAGTDLLRTKWEIGKLYQPIVPRLRDVLAKTGSDRILDLGSGGGGPVVGIYEEMVRLGDDVRITLSDKYPNLTAFRHAAAHSRGGIGFVEEPVDATAVPSHLGGLRTLFLALHHFRPEAVMLTLQDAVQQRHPIAVFDFTPMIPPPLSMLLLSTPLGVLLETPFVRPFRWSRLIWTYVAPIVPFYVFWDAFVSGMRLYSVKELQAIVDALPSDDYIWEIGLEPTARYITYLIGYSESAIAASEQEQA